VEGYNDETGNMTLTDVALTIVAGKVTGRCASVKYKSSFTFEGVLIENALAGTVTATNDGKTHTSTFAGTVERWRVDPGLQPSMEHPKPIDTATPRGTR